eukprot:506228-Rhodomonas_salina.1
MLRSWLEGLRSMATSPVGTKKSCISLIIFGSISISPAPTRVTLPPSFQTRRGAGPREDAG